MKSQDKDNVFMNRLNETINVYCYHRSGVRQLALGPRWFGGSQISNSLVPVALR